LLYAFESIDEKLVLMNLPARHFYDSCPIGVCIVRRDRRKGMDVLYINPACRALIGAEESEPVGRPLEAVWHGPETAKLTRKLRSTTPPGIWTLPVDEAAARWATLTIAQDMFDGEPCFTLWATDISASKKAEGRLRQAVQEADAIADMKANFLATMSHEIRTPMQAIYGLLELIGEEKPDDKIRTMVGIAKDSASGLLEILDDVLDFAKIDADKMELDMFEVPVRTLASGIMEAMAVKARGKDVRLVGEIDEKVPFVVIGDPKRLRQILMNLMSNALKFTARGSVILRVTTKCKVIIDPTRVCLRFEVMDTGIGVSKETAAKLFTPFTQADSSTSRRFGGTGLGLSICKKLVNHMGGQIGIDSVEGRGSTFWFEIPTEEVGVQDNTATLPSLDGISILSVEDHPQGAREIKRSLESMGATVESCPTFKEGLELVKRRPFDVGIIDQGLPDGLGIDLIREIMNLRPFMGLVMYTARDDIGMQHTLTSLGVRYLAKPAGRLGLGEAAKDAARKVQRVSHAGPTRLLIAEDTPSVRDVLQRQLDRLNIEADFVENGQEAWEALQSGKYGIVFTDLHMPEMDGYGLAAMIRKREKEQNLSHFPVVVLTADIQLTQRHIYLGHGFDECLLKPVSLGQLRRLLIRWGLLSEPQADAPQPVKAVITEEPPAVDLVAIRRQMGALDEGSVEMMHMFADMTTPLIARLQQAQARNNHHDLEETAHSLKGAARSACCPVLGDLAERIQDNAGKCQDCQVLTAAILVEFERVRAEIQSLKAD
jgi:two-component system sensor histidine kinase/response regulator